MGWVYILVNRAIPEMVKVGYTNRDDPYTRAKELKTTGVPVDFQILFATLVPDAYAAEQEVHRKLRKYHKEREWFRCGLAEAMAVLEAVTRNTRTQAVGDYRRILTIDESDKYDEIRNLIYTERLSEIRRKHADAIEEAIRVKKSQIDKERKETVEEERKRLQDNLRQDGEIPRVKLNAAEFMVVVFVSLFTTGIAAAMPWVFLVPMYLQDLFGYRETWFVVLGLLYCASFVFLWRKEHEDKVKREIDAIVERKAAVLSEELKSEKAEHLISVQTETLETVFRLFY